MVDFSEVKRNFAQTHPKAEYMVQGVVNEASKDLLLLRLQGLCDTVDSEKVEFRDHEWAFRIQSGSDVLDLNARSSLSGDGLWTLTYRGADQSLTTATQSMGRLPIIKRTVQQSVTSASLVSFLQEIGFQLRFQYVTKGYVFKKGLLKVLVYKVYQVVKPGDSSPERYDPVTNSYLVELSIAVSMKQSESIVDELRVVAEQLRPLVHFEKFDLQRLLNTPGPSAPAGGAGS